MTVSVVALALLLGLLLVGVDAGGGDGVTQVQPQRGDGLPIVSGTWQPLPSPPLPADVIAEGDVTLAEAGGTMLAYSERSGQGPQVWALEEDGAWSEPVAVPGPSRSGATVVATERALVVWGGRVGDSLTNDGHAYVPAFRDWLPVAVPPLAPRQGATGIWTGREMVVVGGRTTDGRTPVDVAAYDPVRNSWRPLQSAADLAGGTVMAAAWTGESAVVWTHVEAARRSALLSLDVEAGDWTALPNPPFAPPAGATGLAGVPGGLLATTTAFGEPGAASLPQASPSGAVGEWRTLPAPPVPSDVVCPSQLEHAGTATVLLSRCTGALFVLDADAGWRRISPPEDASGRGVGPGTQILVTTDEIYYLAPSPTDGDEDAPSLFSLELR
jgi:hypothetical protein